MLASVAVAAALAEEEEVMVVGATEEVVPGAVVTRGAAGSVAVAKAAVVQVGEAVEAAAWGVEVMVAVARVAEAREVG